MAIASWSLVRVFATWVDHAGNLLAGTYTVRVTTRLTNSTDDLIIPAGPVASGNLNSINPALPSLSIMVPATDDPDIQQTGWKVVIDITFSGGQTAERYEINVPIANRPTADGGNNLGVNLRTIALTEQVSQAVAQYGVGVAGGLALLSNDGLAVLDANGDPITGSGGGPVTIDDLPAGTVLMVAGTTRPTARTDLPVIFVSDTDPGSNALPGPPPDEWWGGP